MRGLPGSGKSTLARYSKSYFVYNRVKGYLNRNLIRLKALFDNLILSILCTCCCVYTHSFYYRKLKGPSGVIYSTDDLFVVDGV